MLPSLPLLLCPPLVFFVMMTAFAGAAALYPFFSA